MELKIKIELLEADIWSFVKDKTAPPDGIKIEGPIMTQVCSHGGPIIPPYLEVAISTAGLFALKAVGEIAYKAAKDLLAKKAADWLVKYLARHNTKRARINGRDGKPKKMGRILREEIKIGEDD
jgi:hypothetical protein